MTRLSLPQVTICAASSVNVTATLRALESCLQQIAPAKCLFFTDAPLLVDNPEIEVIPIAPIRSSEAYSRFILQGLVEHIASTHCLIVQWDGHVRDASRWDPLFLDCDYIGASWPQFRDGHEVGNGGFCLRSVRLMKACLSPSFQGCHPEDVAIARTNRNFLEQQGFRFAPVTLANAFSTERAGDLNSSFGYHGAFLMPQVLGAETFWEVYESLDNRETLRRDLKGIVAMILREPQGLKRATYLLLDRIRGHGYRPIRRHRKTEQKSVPIGPHCHDI